MDTSALTPQEQELASRVSIDELMASTEGISQWVRLSGTPEEAEAFDWIEQRLKSYGLETRRYLHPGLVSWPEEASLTVTGADGKAVDIPCGTHAFATSTSPEGLEGELLFVGGPNHADLGKQDVRGKIVLIDGIIAPNSNQLVEEYGIAGAIWIAGLRLHERGLSPVWGTPTPETADLLPKTPSVSVVAEHGDRLRAMLAEGPVRVNMRAKVHQSWKQLPVLIAEVMPTQVGPESDTFVLFSGHVDSWYYGAMDNGTANATQMEVGRLLAQERDSLRRGLRLGFWSGHSHARYAGSAWYADNFWQELHDRCVGHVNVDSVGGREANILSEGNSMSEARSFLSDVIEAVAGQRLEAKRYGRSGDQSFWGHGIPSMLMSLSEQPAENADPVLLALHHQISGGAGASGGLGWWWHTPEDTIDKIDPQLLKRDATIYTLILHRLCTRPILPYDYAAVVGDLTATVGQIQAKAGDHFDLQPVSTELKELDAAIDRLKERVAALSAAGAPDPTVAAIINKGIMRLGRALIPVDYTNTGQFDHDLAVPTKPLPSLQAAASLATLDPESDEYHFLRTRLVRERNRAVYGLRQAIHAVDETLANLESA